jgi:hypothetical protein
MAVQYTGSGCGYHDSLASFGAAVEEGFVSHSQPPSSIQVITQSRGHSEENVEVRNRDHPVQ